MDHFAKLPEGSVAEIISFTSAEDAARSSAVSTVFRSAAESDVVWEKFLPLDYQTIISRSVSPLVYATKKELYLSLCHSPILLDHGKLSFSLDKSSGKKCYMLGARKILSWGDTTLQMEWTIPSDSRFSEVANITGVSVLDIRAKIPTHLLSSKTTYAAYLVFNVAKRYHGLEEAKAMVRFVSHESDDSAAKAKASLVHLKSRAYPNYDPMFLQGKTPRWRDCDKWMEIEMGEFLNRKGDFDGEVEARLFDNREFYAKSGLIVEGIEFRPKDEMRI